MIKTNKSDVVWTYLGIFFNIAMGIIILPIILITMSPEDVGLWYVFIAMQGLVSLVDFGFGPTLIRNITYAFSGVDKLDKNAINTEDISSEPNFVLLSKLFQVGKKIYLVISLIVFIILSTVGTIYLYSVVPSQDYTYYIAWAIFVVAIATNVMFSYYPSFLQGIGAIKRSYQSYFFSRVVFILTGTIGLFLGYGLIALAVMMLLSSFTIRILSGIFLHKEIDVAALSKTKFDNKDLFAIFKKLWTNIKKEGLIAIGNFASSKSLTFVCTSFLGLVVTAQYGFTMQLYGILSTLTIAFLTSSMPEIVSKQVSGDIKGVRKIYGKSLVIMYAMFIVGIVMIVFVAPLALKIIKSNTTLLPTLSLVSFGILAMLQRNYQTACMIISSTNKLVYAWPFFISGIILVCVSSIFMLMFPLLGVWNLVIAQFITETAFNNWYWPYYASKNLKSNYFAILLNGLKSFFIKI